MRFRIPLRTQFYLLMITGFLGSTLATFSPMLLVALSAILCAQPLSHFIKYPRISIFYRTGVRETLLLLLAYLLISLIWGMDAKQGFIMWLKLFGLFIGGCLISESIQQFNHYQKQLFAHAFICGAAITAIMFGIESSFHLGLSHLQWLPSAMPYAPSTEYGSYYLELMIWPCLAYFLIKGKTRMAFSIALMLVFILMKMDHAMAIIALVISALFLVLSYYMPKLSVAVFLIAWSALIIGVPITAAQFKPSETDQLSVGDYLSNTQQDYLFAWALNAQHAVEKDPNGHGFTSGGQVKLSKKEMSPFDVDAETLPLPANAILQFWLELGLIGLFGVWLIGVVLFLAYRHMLGSSPICKMAATGHIVSLICLPLFFTSLWNIPFMVIAILSLMAFSICTSAAARNVI